MRIDSTLTGWDEIQKVFERMPERLEKTALKKGIGKAAEIVLDAAKASNRFDDWLGRLRDSIEATDKVKKKRGMVRYLIRAKAKHAHLVELGHWLKTKNGKKWIPGRHFMFHAYHDNEAQILEVMKREIQPTIDRFVRREMKAKAKAEMTAKSL